MTEFKRTFCRVCEPACGMIAEVEGEQLIRLKPDKEHPVSKGFVCNKGIYGADMHNDPDRLKYPLKRNASGEFEQISWDQALDEISTRLWQIIEEHGTESLAAYTGNPSAFNSLYGPSFGSFVTQLGVRKHFSSGTQDCTNKFAGSEAVFGTRTLHPVPDIDHSDYILIIGENPAVSHMSFVSMSAPMKRIHAAEARGAQVRYINPRRIEAASDAEQVLMIKPDTDVYLLAALLHEIDRTVGFDDACMHQGSHVQELREFVAQWPAERVAPVTGLSVQQIETLAAEFSNAETACVHMSTGVNMGRQGTLAYWLLHMLAFVTGNLGTRGGNFYSQGLYSRSVKAGTKGHGDVIDGPFGPMRQPGGTGINLPGTLLADYIAWDKEPIRAMFINSGNPVLSIAGEARLRDAFESLDLLVCVDIYRNATAEYADYVLPAAGAFEREDINITGIGLQYQPWVHFTEAVVPAGYERKPDWWIYEALAQKMGFVSMLDEENPDPWRRVDAMLQSRGNSVEKLREVQVLEFEQSAPEDLFNEFIQTDDQRLECFPEQFADALTRMQSIFDELSSESSDQLKLITKRDAYMLNSWFSNLPKLKNPAKDKDRNFLYMHPDDAQKRQIRDGDQVSIRNDNGELNAPVRITDELRHGVVAMVHGWGHQRTPGMRVANELHGVNCNVLLPSGSGAYEPLSNQAHMTGIPVDVSVA